VVLWIVGLLVVVVLAVTDSWSLSWLIVVGDFRSDIFIIVSLSYSVEVCDSSFGCCLD
jgi:hypothetical protein